MKKRWISAGLVVILAGAKLAAQPVISSVDFTGGQTGNLGIGDTVSLDITLAAPPAGTLTLVSGNLDSWTLGGLSGSGTAWTAVCTIANNGVQFVSGAMVPLANLVVNDVGGGGAGMAYAASIALPVGLTLDGKPPTGAVVSSSAATGGTPVTGYYNGTNTGSTLTVTFPNSSLDPSIDGGSLAVEVSDNGGGTWSALGSSAAIGAGVAAAGSITVNPGALAAYNGKTLQFRGILTDRAGNTGAAGAAGGSIVVDTTPPTLSTVTIASNNANTARAKVLNTVTVSITASEAVNTPAAGSQMVFSASRTGAALAIAGSGSSYTIAYTIVTGDLSLLTLGAAVPFSIAQITDPAGNVMAAPVTVITGGPVVMYYRGLTWQGAANGDWSTASNWAEGYAPPTADDEVVINSNNPRLTAAGAAKTITVGAGAGLDTDNFSLTVASTFTLSGTAWLRRRGGTTVPLPSGGTVIYHTGGLVQDYGAVVDYPSLEFTAGAYSLGAALTAGTLTVSGAASITGAFPLTVNGTSSLSADVSTAGNQTYTGAVTLGGAVTLAATGGAIVMAAITGGGNNLTLNSGAGTTTVSGNAAALGTVTLHGDSGTGAVTFSGGLTAAALSTTAAAYNLTLTGGGAVTITSAVTCTNTGTLTLNGTPNAITCTGGLTVSGPAGGVTVSGTVATAAAPMTLGAVTLGGTAVLNSGGGAISMAAITGGGNNLTLNSGTGTTTVSGAVSGLGSGTGAALTVGGTGLVTFDSTFTAASGIAASGGSLIFSGDVTLGNGNTGTTIGTTEIAGPAASFSGYDGVSLGNLTLSGTPRTVILNSNGGALAAGTITGGGNDLTLNSGAGTTTVSGNAAALGTVTLHSDSGTGAVTFSGGLTAAALSTTAAAYNLTLTGGGNPVTITTAVTCTNTGTLTLNGTPSAITCTGGLTATAPSGVTLSGTVQTAGGQPIVLGNLSPARNISLAGAAILDAGTGAATFYGGVSGAYNLTISGTGAATFNGAVSGVENLSVAGAGAINADISTTGSQTYTGAVTLGGSGTARTFSSGTNQDITFTGGVTGGSHNLSVIASGTGIVTFGGATTVGTGTPPAYAVDINAGMVRIAGGGSIASAGNLDIRFTADGYDLQPASTTVVAGGTGQVYYLFRDPGKTIEFGPTATASLPGLGAAADIFIDSDFFTTTRPVNIGGLSHQGNIWITVTTAAAAYDLTVGNAAGTGGSGRIGITAALAGLSTLTLNPGNTGVVVSGGGVTTTGNQTYNGKVTLGADADFSAGGGSLVRFASTVNSDSTARSLTVTAADVRFDDTAGTVLPYLSAVTITAGTSDIRTSDIRTTGNQTYTGAVTLGANVNCTANGGSLVRFASTVNSDSTARSLTVTAADVRFDDTAGTVLPYLSAVTITAGTSDIRTSDIRTTGNQTYAGAAVLTYDLTLESTTNGAIALTGGIDGSTGGYKDLTIVTGTASGTVTLGNAASAGTDETMGSLTITASVLTVNPYGDVRPNGLMTVTANVTNNGQITAGPNPSAGLSYDTIYFNRNYTGGISGTLNGNGDTFTRVVFNGETAAVGTFTQNNTVLVLKGASIGSPSTVQKFSQDTSSTLGHIKIENRSGTVQNKVELRSDILQDNDAVLELDNSTVMDLYDSGAGIFRSWSVGGSLAGSQGFYGNHGTLQFNTVGGITAVPVPPPALRCGDLRLQGVSMANRFTVNNAGPATVSAQGNVVIQGAMDAAAPDPDYTIDMSSTYVAFTGDLPQLVLEMTGTGTLQTGQPLGILSVAETAVTTLQNDLSLRGGVAINHRSPTQGVLAAGAWDIAVYAGLEGKRNLGANRHGTNTSVNYARWEVIDHPSVIRNPPPFVTPPSMDALVQDPGGRVVFRRDPNGSVSAANPVFFEILGNTIWRNLDCTERGDSSLSRGPGVLQFSRHPDQHTVLETFTVKVDVPSAAAGSVPPEDYITVTRYDRAPNAASLYKYTYYDTGTGVFVSPVVPAGAEDLPVSPAPGNLKGAVEAEKRKYWNINLVPPSIPGQPILDIQCTNIYFSHAYNQRIPIDTAKMFLKALPFYRSSPSLEGYFNYDWIELRKIIYSFTEDADGNGRIDRIRVQSNTALNGDFSDFEIRVHGYVIDTSRGRRTLLDLPNSGGGFELVSEKTSHPSDQDSFYMYVEEQPFPDGGNTPVWDVIRNTSLRDTITQNSTIGSPDQDQGVQSFDTVPPRISHALTLPGHPQTYVRMSEPVVSQDPRLPPFTGSPRIDPSNPAEAVEIVEQRTFVYEYKPPENSGRQAKDLPVTIPRGNLSYLLRLVTAYGAAELARLPSLNSGGQPAESFTVTGLVDQGVRAMDWHDPAVDPIDWLYYPPPKYPVDWNYSGYAAVFGNGHLRSLGGAYASFAADTPFGEKADGSPIPLAEVFLPPHKLLNTGMIRDLSLGLGIIPSSFPSVNTISRRVTDVLVSLPPLTSRDAGYFAWPVWARYDDSSINPGSEFGGQQLTDTGIIWEFSGQKFLEERDTTLQVRLNPSLAGGVDLFFGIDVPAAVRSPPDLSAKGKGSGGLWLPLPQPPDPHLFSMVPGFGGARIKYGTPAGPSLFNFSFGKTDSGYESGARLDFVLRLADPLYPDQNLFIARLDAPPGQIPFDWYRMVRPFTFDIQDVILQRGGVTILNNVINSLTGENTYIRYRLAKAGRVTIQVFTLDGNLVKVIRREYRDAGEWTDTWNGTNTGGRPVARGMYFVRVVGPGIDEIRKIMVVK